MTLLAFEGRYYLSLYEPDAQLANIRCLSYAIFTYLLLSISGWFLHLLLSLPSNLDFYAYHLFRLGLQEKFEDSFPLCPLEFLRDQIVVCASLLENKLLVKMTLDMALNLKYVFSSYIFLMLLSIKLITSMGITCSMVRFPLPTLLRAKTVTNMETSFPAWWVLLAFQFSQFLPNQGHLFYVQIWISLWGHCLSLSRAHPNQQFFRKYACSVGLLCQTRKESSDPSSAR